MLGVGGYTLQSCSNDITNIAITSLDGNNTSADYHLVRCLTFLQIGSELQPDRCQIRLLPIA